LSNYRALPWRPLEFGEHAEGLPEKHPLVPLPPYAPELNPMENVWKYLRANKLCHLVWDSYEAIVQACKQAWDFLITDPDRIRSVGTRDLACVSLGWLVLVHNFGDMGNSACFQIEEACTLFWPA
jgi:hypothetical protein